MDRDSLFACELLFRSMIHAWILESRHAWTCDMRRERNMAWRISAGASYRCFVVGDILSYILKRGKSRLLYRPPKGGYVRINVVQCVEISNSPTLHLAPLVAFLVYLLDLYPTEVMTFLWFED